MLRKPKKEKASPSMFGGVLQIYTLYSDKGTFNL